MLVEVNRLLFLLLLVFRPQVPPLHNLVLRLLVLLLMMLKTAPRVLFPPKKPLPAATFSSVAIEHGPKFGHNIMLPEPRIKVHFVASDDARASVLSEYEGWQDSLVATGFSYVEEDSLVSRTDEEAAIDLTTLLKELFNGNETLQKSPLYIFAESYEGKFAVTLGPSALKAIEAGELKLQLGGIS
ncbi:hypothetical protein Tsubulata_033720 [Turnera subulata]|uniref:Uncharacterized protein n=1 Tax=Turnera subulata TaxID=218843 RepID=A0A9Q0G4A1_9ROSI|nr:hypothetical protein Tsubulata_033720 [Turnera subulata]